MGCMWACSSMRMVLQLGVQGCIKGGAYRHFRAVIAAQLDGSDPVNWFPCSALHHSRSANKSTNIKNRLLLSTSWRQPRGNIATAGRRCWS
jgi:hypothetical protein